MKVLCFFKIKGGARYAIMVEAPSYKTLERSFKEGLAAQGFQMDTSSKWAYLPENGKARFEDLRISHGFSDQNEGSDSR